MIVALILVGVTLLLSALEPVPGTPWRHLYLVPVVIAGVRGGVAAGVLAALGAVLLFGPVVLREIESGGVTRAVIDGLVTVAVLLFAGALTGAVAARARRQRRRYEALLAAQRVATDAAPLAIVLARLRAVR